METGGTENEHTDGKMKEKHLLEEAREVAEKMRSRREGLNPWDILSIKMHQRGNFTMVTINDGYVGIAKRNPKDKFNPEVGKNLALHRALTELLQT